MASTEPEKKETTTEQDQKEAQKTATSPLRMAKLFEELFTQYDKNGDGLIDYEEWNDIIHKSDETALSHLSESDALGLFNILSDNTGFIKYPALVDELTLAAQQNPTMQANEFVNSFFARYFAVQSRSDLHSPANAVNGLQHANTSRMLLSRDGKNMTKKKDNPQDVVDGLQKKNDALKQQLKDKEVEWAEEKISMETRIQRLELLNEQFKADNEEMATALNNMRTMEMERDMNKEDKNIMKEQMFEMEDDIRRVHDELERVTGMNAHLKQQIDANNEQKKNWWTRIGCF
ncbi:hypothetical protein RFI_27440 [Reticulomyxa filosa]|uniref:EF-hand domain-containing protein n=1 Tax=Reticulomyxa filosa TaxID=46433 RepID=X6M7I2_RETFI|nr:hypothetical protein RFI_27440 [Reticulomyxa filosa]|eukprot:ETO09938.1 hypothetical protein RFI_27440 [Reticulomyxa filosa]